MMSFCRDGEGNAGGGSFHLLRTGRRAIVASGTKNALAVSCVVTSTTARRVRAKRASTPAPDGSNQQNRQALVSDTFSEIASGCRHERVLTHGGSQSGPQFGCAH
jgi:hypothetical protein